MNNCKLSDAYRSREHAYIKHLVLKQYLEKLFMIVGQHQNELIYVDCFAGPWLADKDGSLEDTSIYIALEAMQSCKKHLDKIRSYPVTCRALFIEKDPAAFNQLQAFLDDSTPKGIESACLKGDFIQLRQDILQWCGKKGFAFFFIDPKGWKEIKPSILKPLLKRPNSEFLINFMYEFLNRFISLDALKDDVVDFFSGIPNVDDLSTPDRENQLVGLFRQRLKQVASRKNIHIWCSDIQILDPVNERTKYYLIYLSFHPKGIIVFSEIAEKCEKFQHRIRLQTKIRRKTEQTGQMDLFQDSVPDGYDNQIRLEILQNHWMQLIDEKPRSFNNQDLALFIEDFGVYPSQIQKALGALIKEGFVENMDDKTGKRRTRFIYFDKEERLRRIK